MLFATSLIAALPPAVAEWEPTNYHKRFETPGNGTRLEDNNVWVYTTAFAKRFGMPKRWIDDDLEGAEAVAYRVEAQNVRFCGYFGEADNCRTDYYCTFDLYLSEADSNKLPWKSDRIVDYAKEDSSALFLTPQTRSDQPAWVAEEQRVDRSRLNIGLDTLSWVSGPPRDGNVYSASGGQVRVMAYDREIYDDLVYIELATSCNLPARKKMVRIFVHKEFPDRGDFNVSYDELVKGKTEKAIRFLEYKRAWWRRAASGEVEHVVVIPDSYMARVNEYDRIKRLPKSLTKEIERRFDNQKN